METIQVYTSIPFKGISNSILSSRALAKVRCVLCVLTCRGGVAGAERSDQRPDSCSIRYIKTRKYNIQIDTYSSAHRRGVDRPCLPLTQHDIAITMTLLSSNLDKLCILTRFWSFVWRVFHVSRSRFCQSQPVSRGAFWLNVRQGLWGSGSNVFSSIHGMRTVSAPKHT